jgi:UPF0755 protein
MHGFLKAVTLLVVVAGIAGIFAFVRLLSWADKPQKLAVPAIVEFPEGTALGKLATTLQDNGVVSDSLSFRILVKIRGKYPQFQAGTYLFENEVTPEGVISKMTSGDVHRPIVAQFTIPEGFNLGQIAARMEAQRIGSKEGILKLAYDGAFIAGLGIKAPSLEGYLYPATYTYHAMPTPEQVLTEMVTTFFKHLPARYEEQVNQLGLSLHEAVVFASLIQMETLHDDERPMVSEVIWNRLKDGAPLGIDAALIYGIKGYRGDLTWKHLKDDKNPYNTRIHKGLPPGPIGAPATESLEAVLNPTKKGYYFYVLKMNGEKKHHFSRSLSEHNHHVRLLLNDSKKSKNGNRDGHSKLGEKEE